MPGFWPQGSWEPFGGFAPLYLLCEFSLAKSPSGPLATERKGISQRSPFLRREENFCKWDSSGSKALTGPLGGLGRCLWGCCAWLCYDHGTSACWMRAAGRDRERVREAGRPDWDIKTGRPTIGIWITSNGWKTGPWWSYLGEVSRSVSLFLLFIENLLCASHCTRYLQTLSFYATTILQNKVAKLSHFTNTEAEALVVEVSCSPSELFVRVSAPGLTPRAEPSVLPPLPWWRARPWDKGKLPGPSRMATHLGSAVWLSGFKQSPTSSCGLSGAAVAILWREESTGKGAPLFLQMKIMFQVPGTQASLAQAVPPPLPGPVWASLLGPSSQGQSHCVLWSSGSCWQTVGCCV